MCACHGAREACAPFLRPCDVEAITHMDPAAQALLRGKLSRVSHLCPMPDVLASASASRI